MAPLEEGIVVATRGAVSRALAADAAKHAQRMVALIEQTQRVETVEDCQAIVDAAKVCQLAHKQIKGQLDSIVKPLNEATKAARSLASPSLDALTKAIDKAKRLYAEQQERLRLEEAARKLEAERVEREAAAKREAEAKSLEDCGMADDDDAPPPEASTFVPQAPPLVRGGIGGMTTAKTKTMVIVDQAAAVANHPELFNITLRVTDAKAALERLRRFDPEARLVGIEEKEVETPRLA